MFEITILIPLTDNAGAIFSPEHHATFETEACRRFGGGSWLGDVKGLWRAPDGTVYRDNLRAFMVAVDGLAAAGEAVNLARWACAHYAQEAIFVRYLGQAEIISK